MYLDGDHEAPLQTNGINRPTTVLNLFFAVVISDLIQGVEETSDIIVALICSKVAKRSSVVCRHNGCSADKIISSRRLEAH